ncbi:MAG TPA: ubiquitin-like domain-containing protein [Gemmatimonadales bacterium]|nr:ubiquitin-like domain-containing protein [Gemmatimonadales bacterium]
MSTSTASATRLLRVRVWVPDVWDAVELSFPPTATVADVKAAALRQATGRLPPVDEYEVKFRGALVIDERRTLADMGVRDGAPLIVLPARRRPVR